MLNVLVHLFSTNSVKLNNVIKLKLSNEVVIFELIVTHHCILILHLRFSKYVIKHQRLFYKTDFSFFTPSDLIQSYTTSRRDELTCSNWYSYLFLAQLKWKFFYPVYMEAGFTKYIYGNCLSNFFWSRVKRKTYSKERLHTFFFAKAAYMVGKDWSAEKPLLLCINTSFQNSL